MCGVVVLVNKEDKELGTEEKIKAHKQGKLHRAFSIFIFNSKGEMLIQKRARNKYHSGGLWTNACCSHPKPNEKLEDAAHRRLKEEMGFDCALKEIFFFTYKANLGNNMIEHELDHVFFGIYNGKVHPNPKEVEDFKWVDLTTLTKDIKRNEKRYTYWFKIAIPKVIKYFKRYYKLKKKNP
ncbi:isopentenyl-diphosphate Delta-isomerase [Candidatus Woesearchaeota archaeon]|nr:isopentenyl-diphosphate Delta-isomerase [Candidatus Woesearchaeota archaeon]RLE41126.1 MAG: isopentenyl-diphosphate Delta-isomerase [Candidatus Woesearchaeota archaeon]